ncbi:nucleoside hydrolase [Amycolatopsis regifaucium]|uniref:Nucleoside hydrolase n=1 Tax=Amycolatopsis regifaucium TaxID=546365 RepID=A0A154MAK2_9PSEU|nr:nucleoside hydrolase [Amycolatopsis regifaucium]KZB81556.1 nucleoside hydrolase [Amycolatopsis regifaucium]OKA06874.1 nucleoside hydrolase [Amycolatopsis regifaucium]SFH28545.1 pyrimidine-specific ribonucleoside hydrolase [Amycolatopsis regifaucium]
MGTKLIIDTDPGVDDAFALALAARSDDVDLLGVTTVFGNVPLSHTTANARRLLRLFDRDDVPVAAGAARPLVYDNAKAAGFVHGQDGLSGHAGLLPEAARPLDERGAVRLLADLLEAADEPVTIAPIGPLTNIALLLAAHPELREKIGRLVIMGGGVTKGNSTTAAEFNIWSDPEAARRVLADEDIPTVLVPLDITHQCTVDTTWLGKLAASGPLGAALEALTPTYVEHYSPILGFPGMVMHDAVAVAEAIRPGILDTESYPVDVDCGFGPARGATLVDRRRLRSTDPQAVPGRVIDVALTTDVEAFRDFVLGRVIGGR